MMKTKYIIRQMKVEDFEDVIKMCTEFGFNIANSELKNAYSLDPKGFFVAQDLDSGE